VIQQLLGDLSEVLLVRREPLGGQLLQHVVQHQVHPALQEQVAAVLPGQQVLEQRGPLPREVVPRHLGKRQRDLHRNLVVLLADGLQQLAAQVRLLLWLDACGPAWPPLPDDGVLQLRAGEPARALVGALVPQNLQQAGAEALPPLHRRQRVLRLLPRPRLRAKRRG